MKKKQPFLSVILPVFNERKRLKNLEIITAYLQSKKISSEIIVVNDGSDKDTVRILKRLNKKIKMNILHFYPNHGKGFAIKQGMLRAQGKYCLFMDIDLSTPIETVDVFLKALRQSPIVIATRKSSSSKISRHQPILREIMGKSYTLLSQFITGVNVSDFTCGFKAFSRVAAKQLFSRSVIKRWSFDAEIIFLAKRLGLKIKEMPVVWDNDSETKVVFPRDIFLSLKELLTIKWHEFQGTYKI